MKTFLATVQILIQADNESEAYDSVGAALSENQQGDTIIDWGHIRSLEFHSEINPNTYSEGDFLLKEVVV